MEAKQGVAVTSEWHGMDRAETQGPGEEGNHPNA